MIRLEKVSKSFGPWRVLADVSLTMPQGRTTAVMGLSGSGKSTLLALIVGLETPDQGEVWIGAERMAPRWRSPCVAGWATLSRTAAYSRI